MVKQTRKDTTSGQNSLPLVIIVGPTNVGKSTLFNRLVGLPQAVTAREEGTTRDRVIGLCNWQDRYFNLVDTAGLMATDPDYSKSSLEQLLIAINEADLILFTFDGRQGLDDTLLLEINKLRGKPIFLVANKIDSYQNEQKLVRPNLGIPFFDVSARAGRRIGDLLEAICQKVQAPKDYRQEEDPIIAIIGRPNVGKSTLLNRLSDQNRSIVSHLAGTTRDVVTVAIELNGQKVILADTAGIRRRGKISLGPELFSVKRTASTLQRSTAVLVVVDASEGITRSDLHMLQFAKDLAKPLLLVYNKIDQLDNGKLIKIKPFLAKYPSVTISARDGLNLTAIVDWISDQLPPSTAARRSP